MREDLGDAKAEADVLEPMARGTRLVKGYLDGIQAILDLRCDNRVHGLKRLLAVVNPKACRHQSV